jgi:hypothetical protein
MQSIPRDIYEATLLDGAGRMATLRRVTIPLLWDTVQVAWIYLAIITLDGERQPPSVSMASTCPPTTSQRHDRARRPPHGARVLRELFEAH